MSHSQLLSIQTGIPRALGTEGAANPMDQAWWSGFWKQPVSGAVHVGRLNVAGDGQADLTVHGGYDRPILAYCAEHYDRWSEELGSPKSAFGSFGENFTVSGLDESAVCLGDRYAVGPVCVEVSQPRQPCWKLARYWRNKELPALVIRHNRGGWYFRVLEEGMVEAGMGVELIERPYPQWTICRANEVMYHGNGELAAMRELASCPPLSADWKAYFEKRLGGKVD